ncbi:hypothetical protein EAO71_25755 [Streptomyces sp. ms191]|nr:hypothetical protein EAO71_25755 [Streptomyces sp. ms191]
MAMSLSGDESGGAWGVRTVSKWEKLQALTDPRPDTQAILDTAGRPGGRACRIRVAHPRRCPRSVR